MTIPASSIATFVAREQFPAHKITDSEFLTPVGRTPYVFGIRDDERFEVELHGHFTAKQLRALAGWMEQT